MSLRISILLSAILFVGCASSAYKVSVPLGEEQTLVDPLPGIARLKIRRVQVQNLANLKSMVDNRRNYRLDFFRQSKDPYFGKDRWSDSCLRRNSTGPVVETRNGIFFRSVATADASLKTEVCLQDSVDVVQVIGECRQEGIFFEATAMGPEASKLTFRCPDEMTF